jgi:iron complex transport system ATP-binding protein
LPPSNLTVLSCFRTTAVYKWIGKLTDTDIAKVNEAMELTQISHLSSEKHYEISDGQLQILVARALAQDTPLIILDEPTTHLDLLHKVALFKLLKSSLRKRINAFCFQPIDMAIQLSDEMIIMTRNCCSR